MVKRFLDFCEKTENRIRAMLSRYPIIYALIGSLGVVLFWRGIWHTADDMDMSSSASLLAGILILLVTGLLVYEFIGNRLIISGLIGEEKIVKKEEGEIKKEEKEIETEEIQLKNLQSTLSRLEKKLDHIDGEVEKNHTI
ncbi:MAG: hypothetical protein WC671_03635 [Candidatus Paceibacterota bacterium]|jgi:hypothetical protein